MPRLLSCGALALLLSAVCAASSSAAPPLVTYPESATGLTNVRQVAEAAGKVWVAGDRVAFDPTLVSCIDERTGQKCAASYPISLKDAGGVAQASPSGIAVGVDGAIWVANEGDEDHFDATAGSVSRIDPSSGAVSTFPAPVDAPHAVVVGLDGDVWVANDSNTVSRLDPATGVNRAGYPLGTGATPTPDKVLLPAALAVGRDGDVWAPLFDGNSAHHSQITRFDPDTKAVVPGYPKPTGGDRFSGALTVGADGDVWVDDGENGQLSRLDPVTGANRPGYPRFRTPATAMATGPDGDLWITGGNPAVVDRIDPATGSSRDDYPFALPTATSAIAIAANGDPWVGVTQVANNRLVHVNLSGSTVTGPPSGDEGGGGGGTPGGGDGGGAPGGDPSASPGDSGSQPPAGTPAPAVVAPPAGTRPARDTAAPQVKLSGPTSQKAGASISVTVSCPTEACSARAGAVLTVPSAAKAKRYKLGAVTRRLAAGRRATLKLTLSRSARAAVAKALRSRKTRSGVKVKVTISARDAAGNARRVTRTITLTPK
ncbi:hypothetical protein [Conexibacter sp. CPCC 206217]|uniref:Vgb family protein n=1 Tax=Conexibacter sp. CPCC 206217 TaxID=3064574 RepID=UPI00271989D9|nr:hypothetical protein [Conexibacter sp. CPCC 206217]MDO8212097.1 hypothetical protein [Conexibacter sp. CPCC 206217]